MLKVKLTLGRDAVQTFQARRHLRQDLSAPEAESEAAIIVRSMMSASDSASGADKS